MSADEFKNIGNKHFSAGEYLQAIDAYTKAIALKEDHVFYSNRSACYTSLKQYNLALSDAEKCVEVNPGFARGYSRLGAAKYGLNDKTGALKAFQDGLKVDPNNAGFKEEITRIEGELSRQNPFMNGQDPFAGIFNADMWMKLANSANTREFLSQPDYMAIMKELEGNSSALTKYINDPRVMQSMQVLLGIDVPAGAADAARAEAKQAAQDAEPVFRYPKMETAKQPEPVVEEEEEEEYVDEELEREKAERAALKTKADAEKELGTAAYKKKDFETAIKHYTAAYELVEDCVYLMNLSAVYMELKDYNTTIEFCNKALKENPTSQQKSKIYLRLANAESRLALYADAITHYKQSILEENSNAARKGLKEAEEKKKKADEEAYLDDDLSEKLKDEGNALVKDGEWAKAIDIYTDSIKRNPKNYKVYANRALCFQKLMRWDKAMEDCDKCLQFDKTFAKAYIRKGKILHYLKNYGKALDTYREGISNCTDADLKRELEAGFAETQSAIYQQSTSTEDSEQRYNEAMRDPEIVQIMSDPIMQQVLQTMQSDPAAAQKYMADPEISKRLEKLIAAGIIRFG